MDDEREAPARARHEEARAVIEAEGLGPWLADPKNLVGGRFFILPDGRTLIPVVLGWRDVGRVPCGGAYANVLRPGERGWQLVPAGRLAEAFGPLGTLWKSSRRAGGWDDGAALTAEEKRRLRLAAGDAVVDRLESSPPRRTVWDRWCE